MVQVFGDLLNGEVQSVHVCGEVIEILDNFTDLSNAVHSGGRLSYEALRQIGRSQYLVYPVLLYGCETLIGNLKL